ncbi:MAG: hypothetical protein ACREEE_14935 [Dongiaceae bacterium]
MTDPAKISDDLLTELRSTCQLVLLHPWFQRGSRLPAAGLFQPRSREELEWLLNDLSIVTEVVCQHQDHADDRRETYARMMARVVGTLGSRLAEPAVIKALECCDRRAIEQELSRLRLLVAKADMSWTPGEQSAA